MDAPIFFPPVLWMGCGISDQDFSSLENDSEVLQKHVSETSTGFVEEVSGREDSPVPEDQQPNFPENLNPSQGFIDLGNRRVEDHSDGDEIAPPTLAAFLATLSKASDGEKQQAVVALWSFAADHGIPEAAIMALDFATYDTDSEVAKTAKQALEDLLTLESRSNPSEDMDGLPIETEGTREAESENAVVETWGSQAIRAPSPEKRAEAINTLSHHQSDSIVNVMAEAAQDVNMDIRLQALQTLWTAAGDGLDHDRFITETLEAALSDADPEISEFAAFALKDLDALRERSGDEVSDIEPASSNRTRLE